MTKHPEIKLDDINHDNVQYLYYIPRQINYTSVKLKVSFDESLCLYFKKISLYPKSPGSLL